MAHRGHIGKTLLLAGVAALCLLLPIRLQAQTAVNLSNGFSTATSSMTTNMALGATWSGGQTPTNQNNAFIVFTNTHSGVSLTLTNAASNVFVADSLTVTNMSKGSLSVTFSGAAFFTSGVAQVNFDGGGDGNATSTILTFSSNVTFGAMNFIGNTNGTSSDSATLTLAGASQGNTLLFTAGGTENNFLIISGTLGLTSTLTATNINSTSFGTISGNATVGNVIINNTATNRFTITGSTMSITGNVASVAGGFTLANNATIALSGGGGLIISNVAPLLSGTLNIGNQTVTGDTNWSNSGTVALAGGYIVGNNLTNNGTATLLGYGNLSNVVVNLGTIWATNNTLAFASNIVQGGTVTIGSGSTISLLGSGALTNYGTINLVGAAGAGNNAVLNLGTAVLTNLANGTITGGGIIQNASQVVNLGTIRATNTAMELQFTNANTFGNAGTIGASTGATLTFGAGGVGSAIITNFGTINLTGGTLLSGNITNLANGLLSGTGTITGPVVNQGSMSWGGTISNNFIQTAGTNFLSGNATITGSASVSGGMVNLNGQTMTNGQLLVSGAGVLTNSVTGATVNGGVSNATTISVTANTFFNGPVTNTGAMFFQGAISNNLVNAGAGSVTLNNTATITQTAAINGGTLNLNGQTLTNGLLLVSGTGVVDRKSTRLNSSHSR